MAAKLSKCKSVRSTSLKTTAYLCVCVCGCREEWQWLQALSSLDESVEMGREEQSAPHRLLQDLRAGIRDLMAHINVPGNQVRD